jgi:hypothetical protein
MLQDILLWILGFYISYHFLRKQLALLSEASQLSRAKMATNSEDYSSQLSRRDIIHTAFLLQTKLPPELVVQILDHAEYWLKSSFALEVDMEVTDIRVIGRRNEYLCPGVTYLSTLPIGEHPDEETNGIELVGKHPVRKVTFTTISQDQGWSSFPDDQGTERGCWTWFEAVQRDPAEPVYQEVVRAHQEGGSSSEVAPPPEGRELFHNLHALREWKSYSRTWSIYDEDEETRQWVGELERGKIIDLTVWARYVGWRNRVKSASIDLYIAAVR